MQPLSIWFTYFIFGLALGLGGCATPIAPTGGKPRTIPPKLISSQPANQAVRVNTTSIKLLFSDYLDLANFPKALSITPSFRQPLRVRWQGREAEVIFPEPLRTGTTYVLQLGTDLRDWNGIALKEPIVIAFSTGEKLNKAELSGLVLEPKQGNPMPNTDIFAWLGTDKPDFSRDPDYHTQSGSDGQFTFRYLPESPVFVIATQDRNRNRRLDPNEPIGLPPFRVLRAEIPDTTTSGPQKPLVRYNPLPPFNPLSADTTKGRRSAPITVSKPLRWFLAKPDTTAPVFRTIRVLSAKRLALTFSEPVVFSDAKGHKWHLADSVRNIPVGIRTSYQLPTTPRVVYVVADSMLAHRHRLTFSGLADSTGNHLRETSLGFSGIARADTLRMRFIGFGPEPPVKLIRNVALLWADAWPTLQFSLPPDTAFLARYVSVTDTLGTEKPYTWRTDNGTTIRILPESFELGVPVRITVDPHFQQRKQPFVRTFERLRSDERGSIVGQIQDVGASSVWVELIPVPPSRLDVAFYRTQTDPSGRYVFKNLPEGSYRLRAFRDVNRNGRWDAGSLEPFTPAERIVWSKEPITLRTRWENEVPPMIFEEE